MTLLKKTYKNFKELRKNETEGRDFVIKKVLRNSPVLIMAPHGGQIEPGTAEIAEILADNYYSFYSFEGVKPDNNWILHISSNNYEESNALSMIENSNIVIVIHGCKNDGEILGIGGKNKKLINVITGKLKSSGFQISRLVSKRLSGFKKNNICNKGKLGEGVQIEIGKGLRDSMSRDVKMMNTFVIAIRTAINEYLNYQ